MAGLQSLRYELEKSTLIPVAYDKSKLEYYDEVLAEAKLAVLLNEQNDPHAKL
jgi:hypothetical protein